MEVLRKPGAMKLILTERLIPSVPVTIRVFYGCRLALAWGQPLLAGKWEDVTRHESFEWRTKRDAMRDVIVTCPPRGEPFAGSDGYKPADFDRLVEISEESGNIEAVDENTLLEAMPDFTPFLPHE